MAKSIQQPIEVITTNDRGGYTGPTNQLYPYQWDWDTQTMCCKSPLLIADPTVNLIFSHTSRNLLAMARQLEMDLSLIKSKVGLKKLKLHRTICGMTWSMVILHAITKVAAATVAAELGQ